MKLGGTKAKVIPESPGLSSSGQAVRCLPDWSTLNYWRRYLFTRAAPSAQDLFLQYYCTAGISQ
eukprot:6309313-Amphidinium_carterae.2